jgi:FAD/FMN-containing dehydrogenase
MLLNDIHSQLNPTEVAWVARPTSLSQLTELVQRAAKENQALSVAGGRHAMGGQQFAQNCGHIDLTALTQVLSANAQQGLLRIEAGAMWPHIIAATHQMGYPTGGTWAIRQKQTGVDDVTLAGSICANAHGRGLLMQPLGDDIEDLTLINAQGQILLCSRQQNAELFSLVIGGYGLFGIIYAATLRLMPRQRLKRVVDILDLADAMNAVHRRVQQGCLYGDFQFIIDPQDDAFLRRGVMACYLPAKVNTAPENTVADLAPDTWLRLLKLAHDDKATAFKLYAQHYLSTDGNTYWCDTMQLSTYIPSYADFLEKNTTSVGPNSVRETLVIGEHYVPRDQIAVFIEGARDILRATQVEVIYGTIRAILQDQTSFLPWAQGDFACVIFNLRTPHNNEGQARTAQAFQALMALAIELKGSYFLTYHRHATLKQVHQAHPKFSAFLERKRDHDPQGRFTSDWYRHYKKLSEPSA